MNKIFFITLLILYFFNSFAASQNKNNDTLFVAFWNLQNLFDTKDDPLTKDEEFLPEAEKEWTQERLDKKLYNLSRVIRLMNNGKGPDVIGVCEVEHQSLLDSMVNKFLPDLNYGVAYMESPDERGIDNGLIYKKNIIKINNITADSVYLSETDKTRLVLEVQLKYNEEILTFFVNHFPSRGGGEVQSEPKRIKAAEVLRKNIDEIYALDPDAKIIVIGDFNDEPNNKSIAEVLLAEKYFCDSSNYSSSKLLNLSYQQFSEGVGSYRYKDDWNMIDQIIVSKNLIDGEELNYVCGSFEVFKPYLLQTHTGKFQSTAFPTYGGSRYLGGFSDHYPVTAKFSVVKK